MTKADLLIAGGGPAGCAAAVMAGSLGMRTILIEQAGTLCPKLQFVGSLVNVLGARSGPELATTITADVQCISGCRLILDTAVNTVKASDDCIRATLSNGDTLDAAFLVVATGVRPMQPGDAAWLDIGADVQCRHLWEAAPAELRGSDVLVLGADRPLGTLLRSMPDLEARLHVLQPAEDAYKATEVATDPRVTLVPVDQATISHTGTALVAAIRHDADQREFSAAAAYLNLGSVPVRPGGDITSDAAGFSPPARQHPRILVAGDLRGARYQRIMTAYGTGAEAALTAYYRLAGVS